VLELVGEHLLRVEQQAADQRALAIVDGPCGGDPQRARAALHCGRLRMAVRLYR
jgi:hypothetical protein